MVSPDPAITISRVPRERMRELDLARGIAIVAMVITHGLSFADAGDIESSLAFKIVSAMVSIIAAPAFMVIMGIFLGYSSQLPLGKSMVRGAMLIVIGYVLNFFRGTLPLFVGLWVGSDSVSDLEESPWYYMLEFDILHFAGIAIITLTIIRRLMPWPAVWGVLGAVTLFASPWIWNIEAEQPFISYIVATFTGNQEYAFFPLFPWITFPLFGMVFGALLKNAANRQGLFIKSALTGSALLILSICVMAIDDHAHLSLFLSGGYRHGQIPPVIMLTFLGFQGIMFYACRMMIAKCWRLPLLPVLFFWSENVTAFYCIQWILIGWLCVLLPAPGWFPLLGLIAGVFFFTDRILISFKRNSPRTEAMSS